jgi:hypothetical protein
MWLSGRVLNDAVGDASSCAPNGLIFFYCDRFLDLHGDFVLRLRNERNRLFRARAHHIFNHLQAFYYLSSPTQLKTNGQSSCQEVELVLIQGVRVACETELQCYGTPDSCRVS